MPDPTDAEARAQYPDLLDLITGLCRPILHLPLAQLASVNEQMQALGPILDPTAYMRGGERLREQRRVIDAMLSLQRVLLSLDPAARNV